MSLGIIAMMGCDRDKDKEPGNRIPLPKRMLAVAGLNSKLKRRKKLLPKMGVSISATKKLKVNE